MADVDDVEGMINLLKNSPSYENFRRILMKLQYVVVEGKLRLPKKDFEHLRDVVNSLEDMLDDMSDQSSKQKATKGGDNQRKTEPVVTQAPAEPEAQTKKKRLPFLGGIFGGRNDPESPKSPVKSPKATSTSTTYTGDTRVPQSSQPQAPDQPLLQSQSTAQPGQTQSPDRTQPQSAQPSKQQLDSQAKMMVDKDIGKIIGMLNDLKNKGEVQMLFGLISFEVTTSSSLSFEIKRDTCIGQDLRKEDKEKIIKLVLESAGEDFFKIIPISGEPGLGKTALARLVFNDEAVSKQFDLRAWVSVCQGSIDLTLVVRNAIKSFVTVKVEDLEMDQTKNVLKQEVEGKRYMLVVDGVWRQKPKKWQTLIDLFKGAAPASRIIAITRFPEVVQAIHTIEKGKTVEKPHVLKSLTGDDARSLCMQIALDQGLEEGNTRIKTIGEEIEKKCEGLPLAIRAAARLLYSIDPHTYEDPLVQLREITESNREKKIMEVLKFCYNSLPSPLKRCFAYCSIFPIGYTIDVQTIIKLWIAHGFIIRSSSDHEDAEKIGMQYFMELLRRSFFQDAQEDDFGIVKTCKMHDLMHELAANHIAEDNTISLDRPEKKKKAEEGSTQSEKKSIRHLAFNFFPDSSLTMPSTIDDQALWTVLLAHQLSRVSNTDQDISKTWEGTVARTRRLRVLDLHNSGLSTVPKSIASLKYLTFLDLSRNGMKKLGVSVSSLPNLKTLKLSFCEQLEELPSDIGYLGSLRHLEIDGCRRLTSMPAELVKLTSLVTLPLFVVSNRSSSVLSSNTARAVDLKSLSLLGGTLEILNLERLKVSPSVGEILKDREHLQRLSLRWDRDDDAKDVQHDEAWLNALEPHQNLQDLSIVGYGHHSFTAWLLPFRNLIKFSLYNCPKLTTLPSLDELSSLRFLELQSMNALSYVTKESSSSSKVLLPALEQLTLWDCPNLEKWTESDTAPAAEFSVHMMKLDIRYCTSLTSLPQFPHLQEELYLEYASPQLLKMTMATAMSKLKSLYLKNVEGINSLEQQWVRKLTCLEYLHIKDCPELKSLSTGILAISSLRSLIVENCRDLELSESNDRCDYDGKKDLNLRVLTMERIPKMKSLPQWLQDAHTLQVLKLNSCPHLETFPEWIYRVSSLNRLVISGCHKLASLPRTLSNLNSLYTLIIDDCPLLLPRLQKETGEDWPQIAKVPNLMLKRSI